MSVARRPLRLLVVNEFFWPDVCASSAVLTDHMRRLARLRPEWRITVVSGNRAWDRPEVTWPEEDRLDTVEVIRVRRPGVAHTLVRRGLGFVGFHQGVLRVGRRLPRPDVVMATTAPPLGGLLGLRLSRRFGCPLIYRVFDLYPDCAAALGVIREGGPVHRLWRRIDTRVMRRAAAVVAISRGIFERIARTRGIRPQRLHLLYDGFDADRVRPIAHEKNVFRGERRLAGRFVVQYAGNMGRSHPLDTVLAAAERLGDDPRFLFQFIGVGAGRSEIEPACRAAPHRIELLDYQPAERLAEVLSAADVALVSQADGMAELSLPYKLYGILAAGRPVVYIGPAESEIVGLLAEHGCGFHVRPGDADGLAALLRRLATDEAGCAAAGRRGRALFEVRFTSEQAAMTWMELIERVAGVRT